MLAIVYGVLRCVETLSSGEFLWESICEEKDPKEAETRADDLLHRVASSFAISTWMRIKN